MNIEQLVKTAVLEKRNLDQLMNAFKGLTEQDLILKNLRQLYTKAKSEGDLDLYRVALQAHNQLLIINGDI